jgi:hypothetical protein
MVKYNGKILVLIMLIYMVLYNLIKNFKILFLNLGENYLLILGALIID